MSKRSRRHRKYDTSPLPDSTPDPKVDRINVRISHSNQRDRELAQYLERDLNNGANISDLIKRLLWKYYKEIETPTMGYVSKQQLRKEPATGEIAIEDNMALAEGLSRALDDMEA